MAFGENTSSAVPMSSARSAATSTDGCSATTDATASALTSQITADAPSASTSSTSRRPTFPTPEMPTRRPARDGVPHRCSAAARIPWNTPYAVRTEESPAPPCASDRPVANRVVSDTTSMSAT